MIEVSELRKRYRRRLAVDGLSFQVKPGRITGFLGPNGAGKSTTMRLILGLDEPTAGTATVNGLPYRRLRAPLREVGALLESRAMHGGRTAYHHLWYLAQSNGIDRRRVREVLDLAGIASVAGTRTRGFSLGMAQRLGVAAALLGDPGILILDEPVNGLDAEGVRWIRNLLKDLASEGRTVFLSSHLMSELELTADHLIVIGRGRLIADTGMRDFVERNSRPSILVRSPQAERLAALLTAGGARVDPDRRGGLRVSGVDSTAIGETAAAHRIVLHELRPEFESLEAVYTRLTRASVEFESPEVYAGCRHQRPGWRGPWRANGRRSAASVPQCGR